MIKISMIHYLSQSWIKGE